MQPGIEVPPTPVIPFDPNAVDWEAIVGTVGGVIIFLVIAIIFFQWMRNRHEIAKRKLELEAARDRPQIESGTDTKQVKRLNDRLENLELLVVRLDQEMNQQWEKQLLMKSGTID